MRPMKPTQEYLLPPRIFVSPENAFLQHYGISEKEWNGLVMAKGNTDKAAAWIKSRLHEVENLSISTQKAYLRVMTRNLS